MLADASASATPRQSTFAVHLGDCLDGMVSLPARSVDHVITDPPYDDHTHKAQRIGTTKAEREAGVSYSRNKDLGFEPLTAEDQLAAAGHFARLSRRWTLVFCSLEMVDGW